MPTCVECGYAVTDLYREFSKGNIRLTQCHHCGKFADRYVEYEFVLLFIDLVLHRAQVYRHLLFNRIPYHDYGLDASILQLGLFWTVIDVWGLLGATRTDIRCAYLATVNDDEIGYGSTAVTVVKVLIGTVFETTMMHLGVLAAIRLLIGGRYAIFKYNYVVMALIISSFAKVMLLLMLVWDYSRFTFSWMVHLFVLTSQAEALSVVLSERYSRVLAVVGVGVLFRLLGQVLMHGYWPTTLPIWWFY